MCVLLPLGACCVGTFRLLRDEMRLQACLRAGLRVAHGSAAWWAEGGRSGNLLRAELLQEAGQRAGGRWDADGDGGDAERSVYTTALLVSVAATALEMQEMGLYFVCRWVGESERTAGWRRYPDLQLGGAVISLLAVGLAGGWTRGGIDSAERQAPSGFYP
ncbi:hypothetical protein DFH27DRAFT_521411 [Peziza echinospora]|nr:hypothetical protein DFH27DRAFT_521411 [Peziza echinospora]